MGFDTLVRAPRGGRMLRIQDFKSFFSENWAYDTLFVFLHDMSTSLGKSWLS